MANDRICSMVAVAGGAGLMTNELTSPTGPRIPHSAARMCARRVNMCWLLLGGWGAVARPTLHRRRESEGGVLENRIRHDQGLGRLLRVPLLQHLRQRLVHDAVSREDPLRRPVHPAARAVARRRGAMVHLEGERFGARDVHIAEARDRLDAVRLGERLLVQLAHEPLALEVAGEAELVG